nr:M23 family metallopeptidase [Ardenticatena sp.]
MADRRFFMLLSTLSVVAACTIQAPPRDVAPTPQLSPTLVSTFTPFPAPTPHPTVEPLAIRASWSPKEVAQGETALLIVRTTRPATIRVIFDGIHLAPIAFAPDAAWALLPVAPWNAVGERPLVVQAITDEGEQAEIVLRVSVNEHPFEIQYLNVPPDRTDLLDPQLIAEERATVAAIYQQATPRRLWNGAFAWPLGDVAGILTTQFGTRRSYQGEPPGAYHAALDIAAEEGTPVYATADGVVAFSADVRIRGKLVIINHGAGLYSAYFHMADRLVAEGQQVSQGEQIGTVGNTGLSTGPHLHWELRILDVPVSPYQWMRHAWLPPNP